MTGKIIKAVRAALLAAAGNVSLFVFTAFLLTGVLIMAPMDLYRGQINLFSQYVVIPWGMALCLLHLERSQGMTFRRDILVLFVLLLWIIVPFAYRFGMTFDNISAWYNHTVAYFGIYALLSEQEARLREQMFDLFVFLCGVLAFVMGGLLLYCAATATTIYNGTDIVGFGLVDGAHICHGVHYNRSGMVMVCLAMINLAGVSRSKAWPVRVFYAIAAAMMFVVIVLTQSRTARYAAMIALSIGAYGTIMGRAQMKRRAVQHMAAIAAAGLVMIISYAGAAKLTDAALIHYAKVQNTRAYSESVNLFDQTMDVQEENDVPEAGEAVVQTGEAVSQADETDMKTDAVQPIKAREAIDSTFSERTAIWKNLFEIWKENPKNMVIGIGVNRANSFVVKGTIHEEAGTVQMHNAYLQHMADFGLIGTGLLAVFFALLAKPLLRVFFAKGEKRMPGYTALCMLVIACLATGMMESPPLIGLSPMNMMLFFALALLAGRGEDLALL